MSPTFVIRDASPMTARIVAQLRKMEQQNERGMRRAILHEICHVANLRQVVSRCFTPHPVTSRHATASTCST